MSARNLRVACAKRLTEGHGQALEEVATLCTVSYHLGDMAH